MKKEKQNTLKHFAESIGTDEATVEAPFVKLDQWNKETLCDWLVAFTEDERRLAVWLIERSIEEKKLQRKVMGTYLGNITKSIIVILWWGIKNLMGTKQRGIGERDPNRPWNEKYHDYDNEWYRHCDETNRLKFDLFKGLSAGQVQHVEHVVRMFDNEVLAAEEIKSQVKNRWELLEKWLNDPKGIPPVF